MRVNTLFHWVVPPGPEIDAGREVDRHRIVLHQRLLAGAERDRTVRRT